MTFNMLQGWDQHSLFISICIEVAIIVLAGGRICSNSLERPDLNSSLLLIWTLAIITVAVMRGTLHIFASFGLYLLWPVASLLSGMLLTPWLLQRKRRLTAQPNAIERAAQRLRVNAAPFAARTEGILLKAEPGAQALYQALFGNEIGTAGRFDFFRFQHVICNISALGYWISSDPTTRAFPVELAWTLLISQIIALSSDIHVHTPCIQDAELYPLPGNPSETALEKLVESCRHIESLIRQIEQSQDRQESGTRDLLSVLIKSVERTSKSSPQSDAIEALLKRQIMQIELLSKTSSYQERQSESLLKSLKNLDQSISRAFIR